MLDRLFVYGTLMRGFDHPMARLLSGHADYLGTACARGRLYLARHYPGLVTSANGADLVWGELFRLHQPHALLAQLDDYEGCGPNDPAPAEYRREVCPVTLGDGGERAGEALAVASTEAWTYLYNWPVAHLPLIASGRFELEQS
ncbi:MULTISPECIES: gamma-glutamylcyclotransferase family protein [Rhodopseudomonas]|uniref:Gamma-glutamylcyclotransferase AIG2-like domain-containing protein n=1 Tax=Rhodopseudomonas palustris TaxID=1076 RepID=A0A0D7EDV8_RHOPL|nr:MULTISPECIES: gamma-glutamylcyclotransferase family protein [Rhodopseudomonas]KIZ39029.1 hypothetical protein OO17_21730 [Rhodopseudomonas palustris]MDF3808901.1 gamma-glutamylcyclotransferase [Rhodopseudomonas sp. BAL398]WOK17564.1 gamma-glutamylcyclotransferase family protein [Rhodopseudomonas sp. BAL398]